MRLANDLKRLKIGVLMGGRSKENEVSVMSGTACLNALRNMGYDAKAIILEEEMARQIMNACNACDIIFIALHGRFGEDGTVQGLLELTEKPYTHSGVAASAVAMDKALTKTIAKSIGIPSAPDLTICIDQGFDAELSIERVDEIGGFPLIVKPCNEGSTIGLRRVDNEGELKNAISLASKFDIRVIVEKYICGRELTVGIIDSPKEALPIVEVITKSGGLYDYEAKYRSKDTKYIAPAEVDSITRSKLQEYSMRIHEEINCYDLSRSDFIVTKDAEILFLEINTVPGMTERSLVPKAAEAAGIPYEKLVERILISSAQRYGMIENSQTKGI